MVSLCLYWHKGGVIVILSCSQDGKKITLSIQGDFTVNQAGAYKPTLESLIFYNSELCILDLSACTVIDSIGLGLIMHTYEYLAEKGVKMYVSGADGQVMRMLKIAGFENYLAPEEEAHTRHNVHGLSNASASPLH